MHFIDISQNISQSKLHVVSLDIQSCMSTFVEHLATWKEQYTRTCIYLCTYLLVHAEKCATAQKNCLTIRTVISRHDIEWLEQTRVISNTQILTGCIHHHVILNDCYWKHQCYIILLWLHYHYDHSECCNYKLSTDIWEECSLNADYVRYALATNSTALKAASYVDHDVDLTAEDRTSKTPQLKRIQIALTGCERYDLRLSTVL